jgi:hypothetical protein
MLRLTQVLGLVHRSTETTRQTGWDWSRYMKVTVLTGMSSVERLVPELGTVIFRDLSF